MINTFMFYNCMLSFLECSGEIFCVERIGLTEINLAAFVLSSSPEPRGGALHIL